MFFSSYLVNALRAFTKHYPFQTPRASLFKLLPKIPDNLGTIQAKGGIKYAGYPGGGDDYIVKSLFWFGDFDPWVGAVLQSLVRPGEIVCDIGAYIGDTALPLAHCVGHSGHIYCFEPVPFLQKCIEKNVTANNFDCITSVSLALSDRSGTLKLALPKGKLGDSGIVEEGELNSLEETIDVEVTTFDSWRQANGIAQVAVAKVDVELHELEVLKGMEDALSAHHVGSVVFERHESCNEDDPVFQLLHRYGYKVFRIHKGNVKTEVVELGQAARFRETSDYVAVIENSEFEQRLKNSL